MGLTGGGVGFFLLLLVGVCHGERDWLYDHSPEPIRSGSPNIEKIWPEPKNPMGGAIVTIAGDGFMPAGFDDTDENSQPSVFIYVTEFPDSFDVQVPCSVIMHLSSDTQVVCQVAHEYPAAYCGNDYRWRMRVVVNGIMSSRSGKWTVSSGSKPQIIEFASNNEVVAGEADEGFWTEWFNSWTIDGSQNQEFESGYDHDEQYLQELGCDQPLALQVRAVGTDSIIPTEEWASQPNCPCFGDPFMGLYCGGEETTPCTVDHEVRWYCANKVVQINTKHFNMMLMDTEEEETANMMWTRPGLYDAHGLQYADCRNSWTDPETGVQNNTISSHASSYFRCRIGWTSNTPSIGNFVFKMGTKNEGIAYSKRGVFLGPDAKLYNFQVRPEITSISPTYGSIFGGTRITVFGNYLQNVEISVGGQTCEDVVVNEDGTEATCITPSSAADCVDGNEPIDKTNCAVYEEFDGALNGFDQGNFAITNEGTPCAGDVMPTCYAAPGKQPYCRVEPKSVYKICEIPDCDRYYKRYPAGPGIAFDYWDTYGGLGSHNYLHLVGSDLKGQRGQGRTRYFSDGNVAASKSQFVTKEDGKDSYVGATEGFFKPPFDGYYTFPVTGVADKCKFKISYSDDSVGCPLELIGQGYGTYFRPDPWSDLRMSSSFNNGNKLWFSASQQYYYTITMSAGAGEDYCRFGYVYHGENAERNMIHGPVPITYLSNRHKGGYYATEKVRFDIISTRSREKQEIYLGKIPGSGTRISVCPTDDPADSNCVQSGLIFQDSTFEEIQDAMQFTIESQCTVEGAFNYYVDKGVEKIGWYYSVTSKAGFIDNVEATQNEDAFCGSWTALTRSGKLKTHQKPKVS